MDFGAWKGNTVSSLRSPVVSTCANPGATPATSPIVRTMLGTAVTIPVRLGSPPRSFVSRAFDCGACGSAGCRSDQTGGRIGADGSSENISCICRVALMPSANAWWTLKYIANRLSASPSIR